LLLKSEVQKECDLLMKQEVQLSESSFNSIAPHLTRVINLTLENGHNFNQVG